MATYRVPRQPRYTPEQLQRLQEEFEACELPSKERREALAAELDIPTRSVQIWFQNRRQRLLKPALPGSVSGAYRSKSPYDVSALIAAGAAAERLSNETNSSFSSSSSSSDGSDSGASHHSTGGGPRALFAHRESARPCPPAATKKSEVDGLLLLSACANLAEGRCAPSAPAPPQPQPACVG